ncbi:hypothetical protein EDB82DRAFT_490080 [Fusarium venenatum]|uniref:uncharacterized protein n=1 Tax=Fusarium venenatum TaxID=56646 RepID=UPI001DCA0C6B|nr:hypothetical protein EDB82DRAFT_490080 [Fusarium venenatum]
MEFPFLRATKTGKGRPYSFLLVDIFSFFFSLLNAVRILLHRSIYTSHEMIIITLIILFIDRIWIKLEYYNTVLIAILV